MCCCPCCSPETVGYTPVPRGLATIRSLVCLASTNLPASFLAINTRPIVRVHSTSISSDSCLKRQSIGEVHGIITTVSINTAKTIGLFNIIIIFDRWPKRTSNRQNCTTHTESLTLRNPPFAKKNTILGTHNKYRYSSGQVRTG